MTTDDLNKLRLARDRNTGYVPSKLDYFAGAVLSGLLANPRMDVRDWTTMIAAKCYDIAARMLEESRRRSEP